MPPSMSRWFVAVFALHFLASVLLSTLGLAQPRAMEPDGAAWQQAQPLPASMPQHHSADTASLLDDFDHALMDEQQDLPDILHDTLGLARCAPPGCPQVASPVPDRLSRALAPPDKPPSDALA